MLKFAVGPSAPVRGLLLSFGILLLLPAWAQASDFSFDGGSGCGDPPIFSTIFTLPAANSTGGMCKGFGNHNSSGVNFNSLDFTAPFPIPTSDPFLCSPGPFFLNCDFNVDGVIFHSGDHITSGSMITVEFFGLDGPLGTHHGIPYDPNINPTTGLPEDNFFINLNNPGVCTLSPCPQPFSDTAAGD
jgi:hypothetical protein